MKISSLFETLLRKKQKQQTAITGDIRSLIKFTAENELGIAAYDIDEEYYCDVLDRFGITAADLRLNVEIYKQRLRWKELAEQISTLEVAAENAQKTLDDEDQAEGCRRKKALENLETLEMARDKASQKCAGAVAAHAELLGGADVSELELSLADQLASINKSISRITLAMNPDYVGRPIETARGGMSPGGTLWADMQSATAGLLKQTQRALETTTDPANRARLESQAKAAELKLHNDVKEIKALEKRRDAINKQLSGMVAEKLKPENFKIRKASPSRVDKAKQLAQSMGYGAEQRK
jgi:hypothetical protein